MTFYGIFFFFITKRTLGNSSESLSLANSGPGAPKWFFSILIYLDMQCVVIPNVSLNYYRWNRTQDSSLICPLFKWSLKVSFFSFGAVQFHRDTFTYELLLSSSSSWMSKVYSTVSYDDMRCKVIMFFKIAPVPFCLLCLLWALNRSVHALSFCAPAS